MKAFHFRLEKVLSWRHSQMRTEEERLNALERHRESLTQRISALAAAELSAKLNLAKSTGVQGSELRTLPAFLSKLQKERAALTAERSQCEQRIAAQQARLVKARRDFRVLEKLREQRKEAWAYSFNREVENAAAEAHLSKLIRGES